MRRWTLNEYIFYMRIALAFSVVPIPFQLLLVIMQIKENYISIFIIECMGTLLMIYRSTLIWNIIYSKSPSIESVQYTIYVVVFTFIYYMVNSILLFNLASAAVKILNNTNQLVGIYIFVNVVINIPDYYVLRRLLYYLTYDYDDCEENYLCKFTS
jgi:hypothetical protein